MKIINKTKWNTANLRAIVKVIADEYLEPNQRKRLTVTFVPSRKWVSGFANLGNVRSQTQKLRSTIRMPNRFTNEHPDQRQFLSDDRRAKEGASPLRASIAMVIAHELSHNAGRAGERSMRGNRSKLGWASVHRGDWDWAESMPLEPAPPKLSRRVTDDEKIARIEASIARWETKAKRADTYLKKLRKQRRYYDRKSNRPSTE